MEQHPIPRQMTTFEFKLIGFMTLTQFIYLVVFLPLSYLVFRLFPIPLLNILLAFGVAFLGLALAFLPINNRPLDIWIKNFYKRIMSPTQFFYHKQAHGLGFIQNLYFDVDPHKVEAHVASQEALDKYLSSKKDDAVHFDAAPPFWSQLEEKRLQIASILQKPYELLVQGDKKAEDEKIEEPPPLEKEEEMETKDEEKTEIPEKEDLSEKAEAKEESPQPEAPKTDEADAEADSVVLRLKELAKEAAPPQKELPTGRFTPIAASDVEEAKEEEKSKVAEAKAAEEIAKEPPVDTPTAAEDKPAVPEALVKKEEDRIAKKSAPKKPFFAGVVKNTKNIPLPGILIYVKETDADKPLRLLKTNQYGVFATYSSLPEGIYTFEIRDPKGIFNFDTMKVAVKDESNDTFEFFSK